MKVLTLYVFKRRDLIFSCLHKDCTNVGKAKPMQGSVVVV